MLIQDLYALQKMIYETESDYCLFEALSPEKLREWVITEKNFPFKKGIEQIQFDHVFPFPVDEKSSQESKIR